MSELSPAAQAVLLNYGDKSRGPGMCITLCQAWMDGDEPCNFACAVCRIAAISKPERSGLAAALRAAADQVAPEQPHEDTFEYCCDYAQSRVKISIRQQLLAIADELEGQ